MSVLVPSTATAQTELIVNIAALTGKHDTIRGPVTVRLTSLNRLRYNIRVTREVTVVPSDFSVPSLLRSPISFAFVQDYGNPWSAGFPSIPRVGSDASLPELLRTAQRGLAQARADSVATPQNDAAIARLRVAARFVDLVREVRDAAREWEFVNADANAVADTVNASIALLNNLVLESDGFLRGDGATALLPRINLVKEAIGHAISLSWPAEGMEAAIMLTDSLTRAWEDLKGIEGYAEWHEFVTSFNENAPFLETQTMYDRLGQIISVTKNTQSHAQHSGVDFSDKQQALNVWIDLLESLVESGADAFSHVESVECNARLGGTEYVTLEVVRSDRAKASFVGEPPGSGSVQQRIEDSGTDSEVSQAVATVECPSSVSVSVSLGWVASRVDTKKYGTIASGESRADPQGEAVLSTVNRVIVKEQSKFKQSAVVVVSAQFARAGRWGFHVATGAVVEGNGGAEGTDVVRLFGGSLGSEFMVGLSVSIENVIFISPMYHFVRTAQLSGEIELGEPLPAGVAEVPLVREVKPSVALAVTLRVK